MYEYIVRAFFSLHQVNLRYVHQDANACVRSSLNGHWVWQMRTTYSRTKTTILLFLFADHLSWICAFLNFLIGPPRSEQSLVSFIPGDQREGKLSRTKRRYASRCKNGCLFQLKVVLQFLVKGTR